MMKYIKMSSDSDQTDGYWINCGVALMGLFARLRCKLRIKAKTTGDETASSSVNLEMEH
jgi:hypothetical protein